MNKILDGILNCTPQHETIYTSSVNQEIIAAMLIVLLAAMAFAILIIAYVGLFNVQYVDQAVFEVHHHHFVMCWL